MEYEGAYILQVEISRTRRGGRVEGKGRMRAVAYVFHY